MQNAGEYVVTFPRAYHLGFSHGSFPADSFHLMNICTFSISVIYIGRLRHTFLVVEG